MYLIYRLPSVRSVNMITQICASEIISCQIGRMYRTLTGVYILENTPPPWGGRKKYQPMSFGGKNMKRGREKRGKM